MVSLPIAVVGLVSAIIQGKVAAAGVNLVSKRPAELVKAITSAALVETYAIFALLISILPIFLVDVSAMA
jgi:V/A-type H+-transporting ATPase subunit K